MAAPTSTSPIDSRRDSRALLAMYTIVFIVAVPVLTDQQKVVFGRTLRGFEI